MAELIIQLAGHTVGVSTLHDNTERYYENYIIDIKDPVAAEFTVAIVQEDIDGEYVNATQQDALEGLPARKYLDTSLELTAVQRKVVEEFFAYDTLLFHGSVVAVDGQAYLFTAKSGTGKSTHTRLWREMLGERAVMVNDDKPFLEIKPEGVTAWGSPWMGKHRLGANIGVPLKAICILERGEENRISLISAKEALPMLMQQSQRPQKAQNYPEYLELIDKLAGKVAFYRMACNMDPQAAEMAYRAMSGEQTVK